MKRKEIKLLKSPYAKDYGNYGLYIHILYSNKELNLKNNTTNT